MRRKKWYAKTYKVLRLRKQNTVKIHSVSLSDATRVSLEGREVKLTLDLVVVQKRSLDL